MDPDRQAWPQMRSDHALQILWLEGFALTSRYFDVPPAFGNIKMLAGALLPIELRCTLQTMDADGLPRRQDSTSCLILPKLS
mmetsp:Transcript_2463/g.7283  ORF Transcript_2463/g.7283 Transcript_2463/m.7283 type:complete len:82 (+) Transcript_2463:626-871(+)